MSADVVSGGKDQEGKKQASEGGQAERERRPRRKTNTPVNPPQNT